MKDIKIKRKMWLCRWCGCITECDMELWEELRYALPEHCGVHYCEDGNIGMLDFVGYEIEQEPGVPTGTMWFVSDKGDVRNDGLTQETPIPFDEAARRIKVPEGDVWVDMRPGAFAKTKTEGKKDD